MLENQIEQYVKNSSEYTPITKTLSPIVVGGSVVGLFYKNGVLLASDTGACYGSIKMFKSCPRIESINQNVLISANGEFSDFQEVTKKLKDVDKKSRIFDDNINHTPKDFANYLAMMQYQKRNNFNPYYLINVIAGYHNGQRYLASVDLHGTMIENNVITTGFADYICKPIIENYWKENMEENDARTILAACFKALVYRNTKAFETIQIARVDEKGVSIDQPFRLETKWDYKDFVNRANEALYSDKKFY